MHLELKPAGFGAEEEGRRARGQPDPGCCKELAHIICSPWRRLSAFLAKGNIAETKMELRRLCCCLGANSPQLPLQSVLKNKMAFSREPKKKKKYKKIVKYKNKLMFYRPREKNFQQSTKI